MLPERGEEAQVLITVLVEFPNADRHSLQCDESYPCCFNCARHGVPCSLGSKNVGDGIIPSLNHTSGYLPHVHNPNSNVSPSVAFGNLAQLLDNGRANALSTTNPEQEGWALELLHHWCLHTANAVAYRPELQQVWKVHVPEIGYRCRYVMYGIMAIAALHKAVLLPAQSETYLDLAAYYQTLGLQRFLSEIHRINDDTWQQTFCFSSTVVMYAMCSPVLRKKEAMLDPLQTTADMFTFSRGTRAIMIPSQSRIGSTKLRPLAACVFVVDEEDPSFKHPRLENSPLPLDTFEALDRLRTFVDRLPLTRREAYKSAVDDLIRTGYIVAHGGMQPEAGMVMFWTFVVSEAVVNDISAGDPFGLVVLAHFAVFYAVLEPRFWYFRGWPRLMFRAIDENLVDEDGSFVEALAWPRRQIFETFASSSIG